jgi:hypothetical protein
MEENYEVLEELHNVEAELEDVQGASSLPQFLFQLSLTNFQITITRPMLKMP